MASPVNEFLSKLRAETDSDRRQAMLSSIMDNNDPLSVAVRKKLASGNEAQEKMNNLRTKFITFQEEYVRRMERWRMSGRGDNPMPFNWTVSTCGSIVSALKQSVTSFKVPPEFLKHMRDRSLNGDVEYGGNCTLDDNGVVTALNEIKGEEKSVTVLIAEGVHWHSHPLQLVRQDEMNPFRMPPSAQDVNALVMKSLIFTGKLCIGVVATFEGVYISKVDLDVVASHGVTDESSFLQKYIKEEKIGTYVFKNGFYKNMMLLKRSMECDVSEQMGIQSGVPYDDENGHGPTSAYLNALLPPYPDELYAYADKAEAPYLAECAKYGINIEMKKWDDIIGSGLEISI